MLKCFNTMNVLQVIRMNPDVFDADSDVDDFDGWEEFDEEWSGM